MKRKDLNSFDSKRLHKRFLIFLVLCFNLCSLLIGCSGNRATVREPSWLKVWGDPELSNVGGWAGVRARNIIVGPDNYIYIAGNFFGKVDLDPGPSIEEVDAIQEDNFLLKLDFEGNLIWARTWGPLEWDGSRPGGNYTHELDFDGSGNVFLYSCYFGEYDFDPSKQEEIRTTDNISASYVSKFTDSGDFIEVITWPDILTAVSKFSIDNQGNYLISGMYRAETDIEPDQEYVLNEEYIGSSRFIGRFDNEGSIIWVDKWQGLTIWDFIEDIEGNIFMSCSYDTEIDIDPGEGTDIYTPENKTNEVLLKLDQFGSFEWATSWSDHDYTSPYSLILDDEGNIYATGYYLDSSPNPNADWIPDIDDRIPDTQTVVAFLVKVDTAGNLHWEKTLEGAGAVEGRELIQFDDRVIIAGTFIYVTDFDPSVRNLFIEPDNKSDVFICEFNLNGEFQWVSQIGWQWDEPDRLTMEHISGIAINDQRDIYATGIFGKTSFLTMIPSE
jgi:hypothetical protein